MNYVRNLVLEVTVDLGNLGGYVCLTSEIRSGHSVRSKSMCGPFKGEPWHTIEFVSVECSLIASMKNVNYRRRKPFQMLPYKH